MRVPRVLAAVGLAVVLSVSAAGVSFADPLVTVRYDGTGRLELVGTGWNPNDHAVVLVNSKEVAVTADASGNFDVQAPLPAPGEVGFKLSWRRDSAESATGGGSILQAIVLPVVTAAAVLLLVVAGGTFALRRVYGSRDSGR